MSHVPHLSACVFSAQDSSHLTRVCADQRDWHRQCAGVALPSHMIDTSGKKAAAFAAAASASDAAAHQRRRQQRQSQTASPIKHLHMADSRYILLSEEGCLRVHMFAYHMFVSVLSQAKWERAGGFRFSTIATESDSACLLCVLVVLVQMDINKFEPLDSACLGIFGVPLGGDGIVRLL